MKAPIEERIRMFLKETSGWRDKDQSPIEFKKSSVIQRLQDLLIEAGKLLDESKRMNRNIKEALISSKETMCFDPRDWSLDHRDAWLYGVLVGWGEETLGEVAEKHNWSPVTVGRLRRLRGGVSSLTGDRK